MCEVHKPEKWQTRRFDELGVGDKFFAKHPQYGWQQYCKGEAKSSIWIGDERHEGGVAVQIRQDSPSFAEHWNGHLFCFSNESYVECAK